MTPPGYVMGQRHSAWLGFKATRALLHSGFIALSDMGSNKVVAPSSSISFNVEHVFGQTIKTTAGDDLTASNWAVQVHEGETYNDYAERKGGMGVLVYDDRRGCFVDAAVGKSTFERLLTALESGRMPQYMSVTILGLTYGAGWESMERVWDIEKNHPAVVTEISFTLPVGAACVDDDGNKELSALPATSSDLEAFRTSMQEIAKPILIALYAIAAVAIAAGIKFLLG